MVQKVFSICLFSSDIFQGILLEKPTFSKLPTNILSPGLSPPKIELSKIADHFIVL